MIYGVILAAGASSRMGQPKAALPIRATGETVLGRVVKTLISGGVPNIVIVAGAHVDVVRRAAPTAPAVRVIENTQWEKGQLSSLLAGLDAIANPQLKGAMVTLVDVPLIAPATVAAVLAAWRTTRAPIVRPANGDRHGHPVIFDASIFDDLRSADLNVGAKAVFAAHRERILNVEVNDPGAFEDIDTPEDYQRVLGLGA